MDSREELVQSMLELADIRVRHDLRATSQAEADELAVKVVAIRKRIGFLAAVVAAMSISMTPPTIDTVDDDDTPKPFVSS